MKRSIDQKLGLLGILSLLSYAAAVIIAPRAYPGYDWMSQAVSDLSADSAPSRVLWSQLSALYLPCGIVCCTVCAAESARFGKALRTGVVLFAVMNWISAVGYAMFPLPEAGAPGGFQGKMHLVVTAAVVALSAVSLALIIFGGWHAGENKALGGCAAAALLLMLLGAAGTGLLPARYFGIPERFSVFSATGFNAALGLELFFRSREPMKKGEKA